jgi:hypothetical protein
VTDPEGRTPCVWTRLTTRLIDLREGELGKEDTPVTRPVNLEDFENFSQLCVVVSVVKVVPGTNLLLSAIEVVDGVVRLFRDWLRDEEQRSSSDTPSCSSDGPILWVDAGQNVGLKLRVRQKEISDQQFPILVHRDEMPPVNYEVDIEGLDSGVAATPRARADADNYRLQNCISVPHACYWLLNSHSRNNKITPGL